jgi:hypothetical protein
VDGGVVERKRATEVAEGILRRLVEGRREWPLSLVRELYVFGSFARGALQPGDVDLDVEFDHHDDRWAREVVQGLSYGYDPCRVFRQALVGRRRGAQFLFDGRTEADFDMTLLWRRGDDLPTALGRLHAIKPDPQARRADRDAMLPEFEGMDHWLPRPDREQIFEAVEKGALHVERLVLKDVRIDHPLALDHLETRWAPSSPLYRAGQAVFGYLLARGVDPGQIHLHGRDVRDRVTPYFAGFQLRYLRAMQRCFLEHQGTEWIEVIHPTRRGDLLALKLSPASRAPLKELNWQ